MRLTALRLHNVRRFGGHGVRVEEIGEGVNVLCAANEFGKSTCFDALHALFFQPHTGTSRSLQELRPYSGGSPVIEVDLVNGEGAYRITKQFFSGRRAQVREQGSGRLLAQADEAERFIADLMTGGTGGPAGLLWVRQGVTWIDRRARVDEAEKQARESILTSVQGEVEALTGGRRMADVLVACEADLTRLVTGKARQPKTGGPYAAAIEERDRLAAEERRLAADVEDLRSALDSRRSVRARLAEADRPEKAAERRAALAEAEAELAAAKTQSEALKTAQSEAALAANLRESAARALADFRQALARHAECRAAAADAERDRNAARERQGQAAAASHEAARAIAAAENEEREQRDLLARLDRALRAREAAERLASQREALRQAEAARDEVERTEAALRSLALPAGKLAELERVEEQIRQHRAAAEARAPRLRIDYAEGAAGAAAIEGRALADGAERAIETTATVEIAGVGRLTITVPKADEHAAGLAEGEAQRRKLLGALGVETLAAGRLRESKGREVAAALELARQRLALLAPQGLQSLRETIARLEEQAQADFESPADPEVVRERHAAAETAMTRSRAAAEVAGRQLEIATAAVVETERRLAGLSSTLETLAQSLGPETDRAAREERLRAADEEAQRKFAAAEARLAALSGEAGDLAAAEARCRRLRSVDEAAREEIVRLREEVAGLESRIQTRAESGIEESFQEIRDKLAEAQRRVDSWTREVALLTRLKAALEAARAEARDHYFAPVVKELVPLIGLLFEGASVTFDDETLLPASIRRDGLDEPVGVLSGGMREQLAILTRLAFARLLTKEGRPAPVILDDALVYSDDDRIEKMFDALHRQASDQQIIIFSCRQRAFSRLGGKTLRMEPWQPDI